MAQFGGVGSPGRFSRGLRRRRRVSRRHAGLAVVWVAITVLLNALIVPLSISGLEAVPVWEILGSPRLQVAWGAGLGLLSTLCVCGCLWADVVRDSERLPQSYEAHLLRRVEEEEASVARSKRKSTRCERKVSALSALLISLQRRYQRTLLALSADTGTLTSARSPAISRNAAVGLPAPALRNRWERMFRLAKL